MKISQEMREAIIGAADDLFAKGNSRPTNEQVRAELGRGSLSHISPIMKQWRESKRADESAAFELPDSLRRAVQDSINRMWVTATNLANESVEAYRREADKAVQDADQERDEALNEVSRLEVIVEELEKALSDQSLKVERLEVKLGQEQSRCSELLTENASIEADLAGRKEQIERLHNDIDVVRKDYRALQSELIQMAKTGKNSFEK